MLYTTLRTAVRTRYIIVYCKKKYCILLQYAILYHTTLHTAYFNIKNYLHFTHAVYLRISDL